MRFCYCESPLQLAESIQYNSVVPEEDVFYLVRDNGSEVQRAQFQALLGDERKYAFVSISKSCLLKKLLAYPLFILILGSKSLKVKEFLVGDARSFFVQTIYMFSRMLHKNIILVDDGLYLLNFWKKISHKKYTIFTNLPLRHLCECTSLNVIEKEHDTIKADDKYAVIFIGMKLVEINFLPLELYLDVLRLVISRSKDKELIYYAHREESEEKLSYIAGLGFNVVRPGLPLELFLRKEGARSGVYYTFYSTALYNLSKIILGADFVSIRPGRCVWPEAYRSGILDCYKLLELTEGILIEDFAL